MTIRVYRFSEYTQGRNGCFITYLGNGIWKMRYQKGMVSEEPSEEWLSEDLTTDKLISDCVSICCLEGCDIPDAITALERLRDIAQEEGDLEAANKAQQEIEDCKHDMLAHQGS